MIYNISSFPVKWKPQGFLRAFAEKVILKTVGEQVKFFLSRSRETYPFFPLFSRDFHFVVSKESHLFNPL